MSETPSQALEVIDVSPENIMIRRKPEVVLKEAQEAAQALQKIIAGKAKKVMFNGEQYLEFEDWQTVARFYGLTSEVESVNFVDYGGVKGFSARAIVKRADGMQMSAAEAECLNDEEKWRSRAKYEWKDGPNGRVKEKIGEEPVPLFQLKSMAQTRAQAKALRNVLSWVVVLAGYKATPAEELTGTEEVANQQSTGKPATQQAASTQAAKPAADSSKGTKVKSVTEVNEDKKKPGRIELEDGRSGTTFDKTDIAKAQEAKKNDWEVLAKFDTVEKNGRSFTNLASIERIVKAEPTMFEDKEPVGTPEKVQLKVQHKTPEGKPEFWIIHTDRRMYVTDTKFVAEKAETAFDGKGGGMRVKVDFDPRKTQHGVANVVTNIAIVDTEGKPWPDAPATPNQPQQEEVGFPG